MLWAGTVWDDEMLTTANPLFQQADQWYAIWFTTSPTDYYPVTWMLFWLEFRLFGTNFGAYHAVNVLLHVMSTVLLWRVLCRLEIPGAWFAALAFGVHPTTVASAGWISQGKNTLSLLFYAACTLLYLRFDDEAERGTGSRWLLLSLAAYAVALLSKTSGVLLPVVLLACSWWRRRGTDPGEGYYRRRVLALIPYAVLGTVLAGVTIWFQHHRAMEEAGPVVDWTLRLAAAGWIFWFYLLHTLVPASLMAIYPYTIPATDRLVFPPFGEMGVTHPLIWLPDAALLVCLALFVYARRGWGRPFLFAFVCGLSMLAPVLGFVGMSYWQFAIVSDHLSYLGSIAFIALGIGGAATLLGNVPPWKVPAVLGLVAVLLGGATWRYEAAWQDKERLWTDTLGKNPGAWAAHVNLGSILEDKREYSKAIEHYREAVRIHPAGRSTWFNMGHAYAGMGKAREAIGCYREALRLDPSNAQAHNNMGAALHSLDAVGEARYHYEAALSLWPDYSEAHYNLGSLLKGQKQLERAAHHLREAIRLRPHDNPQPYFDLAAVVREQGNPALAVDLLNRAIPMKIDNSAAWRELGHAYVDQKQWTEAAKALQQARALDASHAETLYLLGLSYAHLGLGRQALGLYRAAEEADPRHELAFNNHAWLLATSKDASLRNGALAEQLAARACELSEWKDALYVDTVAAAAAESGDFPRAADLATSAIRLAERAGDSRLAGEIKRHLEAYRKGQAWRE